MIENWKAIPGYPGYEASDWGRIRGMGRWANPRILKPGIHIRGYEKYSLYINGKSFTRLGHRLVAAAWLENPFSLPEVNHIDANKTNNVPSNLEWADRKGNVAHAKATGLYPTGEKHHNIKLSDADVVAIHLAKSNGEATASIARRFCVSKAATRRILQGKERKPIYKAMIEAAAKGRP